MSADLNHGCKVTKNNSSGQEKTNKSAVFFDFIFFFKKKFVHLHLNNWNEYTNNIK